MRTSSLVVILFAFWLLLSGYYFVPFLLAMGVALTISNTKAVVEALMANEDAG